MNFTHMILFKVTLQLHVQKAWDTLYYNLQMVFTEKNMTIIGDKMFSNIFNFLFYFQGIFVAIVFCYMNGEVCGAYCLNVPFQNELSFLRHLDNVDIDTAYTFY